jgi:hypothetical protein
MTYRIEGVGPEFPHGYHLTAESAETVVVTMPLVEDLCGQVLVFDAGGRQLTLPELQALAQAERAARA